MPRTPGSVNFLGPLSALINCQRKLEKVCPGALGSLHRGENLGWFSTLNSEEGEWPPGGALPLVSGNPRPPGKEGSGLFSVPLTSCCLVNALIHTTVKIWTVKAESDLGLWSQPLILQMTTRSSGSQEVPKVTEQAEPPSPDRWA